MIRLLAALLPVIALLVLLIVAVDRDPIGPCRLPVCGFERP